MAHTIIDTGDITFVLQVVQDSSTQLKINIVDNRCAGQKQKYVGSVPSTEYDGKKVISSPEILLQMIQDGLAHKDGPITVKHGVYNDMFMIVIRYEAPYLSEFLTITCSPQENSSVEVIADLYQKINDLTQKEQRQATKIEEQDALIHFLLQLNYVELNSALQRKNYTHVEKLIKHHCPYNMESIILMLEHGTYQLYKLLNIPSMEIYAFRTLLHNINPFSKTACFLADPIWFTEIYSQYCGYDRIYQQLIDGHHMETIRAVCAQMDEPKQFPVVITDTDIMNLLCSLHITQYVSPDVVASVCLIDISTKNWIYSYKGGVFTRSSSQISGYKPVGLWTPK